MCMLVIYVFYFRPSSQLIYFCKSLYMRYLSRILCSHYIAQHVYWPFYRQIEQRVAVDNEFVTTLTRL